jgi:hypothetical protein
VYLPFHSGWGVSEIKNWLVAHAVELGGHFRLVRLPYSPELAVAAPAIGIASLYQIVRSDAMKSESIVELLADELFEMLHVLRGDIRVELDFEGAIVGLDHGNFIV